MQTLIAIFFSGLRGWDGLVWVGGCGGLRKVETSLPPSAPSSPRGERVGRASTASPAPPLPVPHPAAGITNYLHLLIPLCLAEADGSDDDDDDSNDANKQNIGCIVDAFVINWFWREQDFGNVVECF